MIIKIIIYISGLVGGFIIGFLTGKRDEQKAKNTLPKNVPGSQKGN